MSAPGLICPHCGTPDDTQVTDSRQHVSGRNRRHHCGCGKRFSTIEVVVSEKPRRLVGHQLSDIHLSKAKLIARVATLLEDAL